MREYAVTLIAAFIGTMAFSIYFNLKKERLFYAAVLGTVTSIIYFACMEVFEDNIFVSNFIASIEATIVAELSARWKKAPAIVFLLPSIITLIPGGSFYYTMSYLVNNDQEMFRIVGEQTIEATLGLAVGILIGSVFFKQLINIFTRIKVDVQKR